MELKYYYFSKIKIYGLIENQLLETSKVFLKRLKQTKTIYLSI